MTKENLKKAFNLMTSLDEAVDRFAEFGLDFANTLFYDVPGFLFDLIIESNYTEEGQDIINWFFFEKNGDPDIKMYDESGNEVCKNFDELYEYVKRFEKNSE